MKTLSEFLQEDGRVKTYLQELMQKYNINEETRVVTGHDLINIMTKSLQGVGYKIEPFTDKRILQAGLFGLEENEDGTTTLLLLNLED